MIFSKDASFAGVSYGRWLLIHLHVALLGWIALLIVTVGRNLGPMLAQAPAAPPRAWPLDEFAFVIGLWLFLAGIGAESRPLTLVGAAIVVLTLARFALLMLRVARTRRGPLEAPLVHVLLGGLFLAQAGGVGFAIAAGAGSMRMVCGYVVLLLVGWAGGVVLGHVSKLLSLSVWVWWPPGPRPKQAELYPRTLGLAAAAAFAVGVESLAIGVFVDSLTVARLGACLLCGSAVLSIAGAALTWRRRSGGST